jgi:hypothetical protein
MTFVSGYALALLGEWYKRSAVLGLLLLLLGLAAILGGRAEAGTVYPFSVASWVIDLLALVVFALYFYFHVRWIAEIVGHHRELDREEHLFRYMKVLLFFILMTLIAYSLSALGYPILALILWLVFLVYPVAVSVDDVGEMDNLYSTIEAWKYRAPALLEFLFVGTVLLLTAYFLEIHLGLVGEVLSLLLTVLFTIPFSTTVLSLAYLLRYPLTRRAIEA